MQDKLNIKIVAVCDPDATYAKWVEDNLGKDVTFSFSLTGMLATAIDALWITTSVELRAEHVIQGLRSGRSVVCQPPFCATAQEVSVRELRACYARLTTRLPDTVETNQSHCSCIQAILPDDTRMRLWHAWPRTPRSRCDQVQHLLNDDDARRRNRKGPHGHLLPDDLLRSGHEQWSHQWRRKDDPIFCICSTHCVFTSKVQLSTSWHFSISSNRHLHHGCASQRSCHTS